MRLETRLGNDLGPKFPELGAIGEVLGDAILDGELVILSGGLPDWGSVISRRQARPAAVAGLAESRPATLMLFDVLRLAGEDLQARPYVERRAILTGLDLVPGWEVPPTSDDGPAMVAVSREFGLEGIVAKRVSSRYQAGRRSRSWIKWRHKDVVDVFVAGWRRRDSGGVTILLAEAAGEGLVYVGSCTAPRSIVETLARLAVKTPRSRCPTRPARCSGCGRCWRSR